MTSSQPTRSTSSIPPPGAGPPGFDTRVLIGILFMMGSGTVFPVMNGLVQVLSHTYPSEQVIWARTASHLLVVLLVMLPRQGLGILRTRQLGAQLVRSTMLLGSTTLFFFAVKHVPLAKAAAINFVSPFYVALLAWPILGERLRPARLAAVCAGFLGVLVVIRPGSEVFHPASVLILLSSLCYALYQVYTRAVAGKDPPETSVMYSALVGTVVMTAVLPFAWKTPESLTDAALLASLGVFGAAGHWCVAKAMTYAQASVVSPFIYWQMVGSVIVGWLFAGTLPDLGTWVGAAIIIAAGVWIAVMETRRR